MNDDAQLIAGDSTHPVQEGMRFGRRALAYILDVIAIYALNYVFGLAAGVVAILGLSLLAILSGFEFDFTEESLPLLDFVVGLLISIAYFSIFETAYGATLGKIVLQMRVIGSDGRPPALDKAMIRAGWRFIDGLFFGLVAASSMKPPLQQRYGDKKADTFVVSSHSSGIIFRPSAIRLIPAVLAFGIVSGAIQVATLIPVIKIYPGG